nr:hypothetical protein [Nostoc sp. MG11]
MQKSAFFTRDLLRLFFKLFNTLDRDQDGKVSINELFLSPGLSAIISSETNTSSPQELLVRYDSTKSSLNFS